MTLSKKILAAVLSGVVVVGAATTGIIFATSKKSSSVKINKSTPETYLTSSIEKKLFDGIAKSNAKYEIIKKNIDFNDAKSNITMNISLDKAIRSLINDLIYELTYSDDINIDWLNSLNLGIESNICQGKESLVYNVGINNQNLVTLDGRLDFPAGKFYFGETSLLKKWLYYEDNEEVLSQASEMMKKYPSLYKLVPSNKELVSFIQKYLGVIKAQVKDVEITKDYDVSVGSISEKGTKLAGGFTYNQIIAIVKNFLTTVRDDQELKNYVLKVIKTVNDVLPEDSKVPELENFDYQIITDFLNGYLDEVESWEDEGFGSTKLIDFALLLNAKDDIIGTEINVSDVGKLNYAKAKQNENFESNFVVKVEDYKFTVATTGTEKDGILSSKTKVSYQDSYDKAKLCDIGFENFDLKSYQKGITNGTVSIGGFSEDGIEILEDFLDDVFNIYNRTLNSVLETLASFSLEVTNTNSTYNNTNATIGVKFQKKTLGTIDYKSTLSKGTSVSFPTNAENVEDVDDWTSFLLENIDFDAVMSLLEKCGCSDEILEIFEELTSWF